MLLPKLPTRPLPATLLGASLCLGAPACGETESPAFLGQSTAGVGGVGAAGSASGSAGTNTVGAGTTGAGAGAAATAGRAGSTAASAGAGGAPIATPEDDAGQEPPPVAGSGAGPDAGVSADAATTFADSFDEGATLDQARYEIVHRDCMGDGTIALDPAGGRDGSGAVRAQSSGGYCNHVFVRPKLEATALPNPLYGRVFIKLMTPLAAGHTTFMAMHDVKEGKDLRLGGQNEVLVWNRESDDATLPELSPTGVMMSAAIPAGEFHCLEWAVDPAARSIRTWLDEREIPGLTLDGQETPDVDRQWLRKPDWSPELTDVRLGWESYGDQANTLWFDDLALGAARIGCGS